MKARLLAYVAAAPARQLALVLGGVLAIVLVQAWLALLRQPLAEYLQLKRDRVALDTDTAVHQPARLAVEVEQAERQVAALEQRLPDARGTTPSAADASTVLIVDRLAGLARGSGVALGSMRPGSVRRVLAFDETTFNVHATGSYPALVAWLTRVEQELEPWVVTQLSIRRGESGAALDIDLRLAAYRAADSSPGAGK